MAIYISGSEHIYNGELLYFYASQVGAMVCIETFMDVGAFTLLAGEQGCVWIIF